MSKLIPMDEAAKILGMTLEQLTEMRTNNEIFGYRDGSNWKFKMSELERVAGELGIKLKITDPKHLPDDISESFGFDLADSSPDLLASDESSSGGLIEELDSEEYIEDSSVELIHTPKTEDSLDDSSIDLGGEGDGVNLEDSGLLKKGTSKQLDDSGALRLDDSGALRLDDSGDLFNSDDKAFEGDEELSFGSSSLRLASDSGKGTGKGSDSNLLDEEPEKGASPSDTGKMVGEPGGDELLISDDDLFSDELSLADSASFEESAELSSDFEDSDLVLDDSDSSSEVKLEANESGINLQANESGIAFGDEPLELGGSDIDALELPEDDDMIILEDPAAADAATMLQEDDFNLTPLEASVEDDSSGSQIIALEDSEIYADEEATTILGADDFAAQPAMLDDVGFGGDFGGYQDAGLVAGAALAGPAELQEAPYSMWQVISLGLVATLLMTGGMVAYNLAQNMWMPEDQIIGKGVLNFFLRLTGME